MSILARLRRRGAAVSARAPNGGKPAVALEVGVDSFEYVRVGRTALMRASGRWLSAAPGPLDFTLEVRLDGEPVDAVRALVEAPAKDGGGKRSEGVTWRAAFPASLEAVEDPDAEFALLARDQRIALDPPRLRALLSADSEHPDDIESRVREAEAGLGWLRDQLAGERRRRRALEDELAEVRAERERALSPALAAAEDRYREVRYEMSRIRSASEETVANLEAALANARAVAEMADAKPTRQGAPEAAAGAVPCAACDATGRCPDCGGSGKRMGRRCRGCLGDGGCRTCAGMGYVLKDDGF
jgi:hypothetical protein